MTCTIGIVGGGPRSFIPTLYEYASKVDYWIGADAGAVYIAEQGLTLETAIGDFDSVSDHQLTHIKHVANQVCIHPEEKNETDLELAIIHALKWGPTTILFFGVTGGRLDHTLVNVQLLYRLHKHNVHGVIIDVHNEIQLYSNGSHTVTRSDEYPYLSFIPMSAYVTNLSLQGFYYPLRKEPIQWGSTLCLSNKLLSEKGTFSFDDGILILIKSRDQRS